jgi:hypothetical protein
MIDLQENTSLIKSRLIQNNGKPLPRFASASYDSGFCELNVGTGLLKSKNGANKQLVEVRQAIFDFDGTLEKTEALRQLGWYLTACRPEYAGYFGGVTALKAYHDYCRKELGIGPFQSAIGATEKEHSAIVADVAVSCRTQFPNLIDPKSRGFDQLVQQFNIEQFRADRNDAVRGLMKRTSFIPNPGMWESFYVLAANNIPSIVVTQSRVSSVVEALMLSIDKAAKLKDISFTQEKLLWEKFCGKNFEKLLMLCIDQIEAYGLHKKPSREPHRFGNSILTLLQSRTHNPLVTTFSNITPTTEEYKIAAALAKHEPGSEEYIDQAYTLMGRSRSARFLKYRPNNEDVVVVEDSDTGLRAAQDFSTFFVDNGVGASSKGRPLTKIPALQTEAERSRTSAALEDLFREGSRVDHLGLNLLGFSDLLRFFRQPLSVKQWQDFEESTFGEPFFL